MLGIVAVLGNFGFGSYIIQHDSPDDDLLSSLFWVNLVLAFALFGLLLAITPMVADFYKMPPLRLILPVVATTVFANLIGAIPAALMTKHLKFKAMNIRNIALAIASGIFGVSLALGGWGVWALVGQGSVLAWGVCVSNFWLSGWRPRMQFSRVALRESLRFGVFMFLSELINGVYSRLDTLLIGKIFSLSELGYYSRAQTLSATVRNLPSTSLLNVLYPTFAQIKYDDEKIKHLYFQYFELISFSFCLLGGFFYLAIEPIYAALFGARWAVSAHYFQYLILVGCFFPLSSLMLTMIEAKGESKLFFQVEAWKKILFLPLFVIAFYGGIVAYLRAYVVFCLLGTVLDLRFLNRIVAVGYRRSAWIWFKYALSGMATAVILYAVLPYQGTAWGALGSVSLLVSGYFGLHFYTHSPAMALLLRQIKQFALFKVKS
jgi:teichuronic acid exporter